MQEYINAVVMLCPRVRNSSVYLYVTVWSISLFLQEQVHFTWRQPKRRSTPVDRGDFDPHVFAEHVFQPAHALTISSLIAEVTAVSLTYDNKCASVIVTSTQARCKCSKCVMFEPTNRDVSYI